MLQIPGLYVLTSDKKGRSVYCQRDISAGDTIEVCNTIIIPAAELPIIHKTRLHDYYFLWGEDMDQCALALGHGSIYNHAVDANCDFLLDMEYETINIFAVRNIPAGEEITINYHGEPGNKEKLWFEIN